jgi:hypothetical protein
MKKIYTVIAGLMLTASVFAQAPEKMSYQAVVRNTSNNLTTNQAVGMQISILQTTATGTAVYVETQTPNTNANGLVSIEIGSGTVVSGTFNTIDWSAGPYFIKTETDPTGGITYTITGTSQLMSVPYALHAKTAENVTNDAVNDADADPNNELQTITRTGTTVTLTNGGAFTDSVGVYTAGTGIDITNNIISTTSACGLAIGQTYQGGIIFYLDASGCHGLISGSSNLGSGAVWWNGSNVNTKAYGNGLFEGRYNTKNINWAQGGTTNAVGLCYNHTGGGFTDWYLPSIEELRLMRLNIGQGNSLGLGNIGQFDNGNYWSSSESYNVSASWAKEFTGGNIDIKLKSDIHYVRAVRAF